MSELNQPADPTRKTRGYHGAIHLRVTKAETVRLEAHAERLASRRNAKVSLSEAVRDLLEQALAHQEEQPWEAALKNLPFVTWGGGKPVLPPMDPQADDISLAAMVLEDRGPS